MLFNFAAYFTLQHFFSRKRCLIIDFLLMAEEGRKKMRTFSITVLTMTFVVGARAEVIFGT